MISSRRACRKHAEREKYRKESILHAHSISILKVQSSSCNAALPSYLHCNIGHLACNHQSAESASCNGVSPARLVGFSGWSRWLDGEGGRGMKNEESEPIG